VRTQLEASRPAPQVVNTLKPRHRVPRARDSIQRTNPESRRITQFECPNLSKKKWPVLRSTASQTQLGFQSALILQRLRGQGYGDSPDAVFHSFSTAHINNRLSDTIECSQPLPKNSNPKFSTLSMQKHYPTPEWCAGCSQPAGRCHDHLSTRLRSPLAQRSSRRRSHLRCAAIRSAVIEKRSGCSGR
jgi:hypothetical protein